MKGRTIGLHANGGAIRLKAGRRSRYANEFGVTLAGFVQRERFNIYAGAERILTRPQTMAIKKTL